MLDISLLQMKYAVEIANTGSISRAAKNLYMNQPNLSKSIKELEIALGSSLFVRTPKGVIPTDEGKLFLEYADDVLQKVNQLEEKIRDRRENRASFNISIPRATYITYAFTEFVKNILDIREISINYNETNTMEAIDNLLHHSFDLGIIRYPADCEPEFQETLSKNSLLSRKIWEYDYLLLLSKDHPLAKKPGIHLADLEEYTELVHGDTYVPFIPRKEYNQSSPSVNESRHIYLYERGSQFDLLRNVPTTYMWVSPLPPHMLPRYGLVQRRCLDPLPRFTDILICRADYQFSSYASRFVETLLQVKEQLEETVVFQPQI